jgi:hypothetical protein
MIGMEVNKAARATMRNHDTKAGTYSRKSDSGLSPSEKCARDNLSFAKDATKIGSISGTTEMYRGRAIVERPTNMVCANAIAKQCISSIYLFRKNLIKNCMEIDVNVKKVTISEE